MHWEMIWRRGKEQWEEREVIWRKGKRGKRKERGVGER